MQKPLWSWPLAAVCAITCTQIASAQTCAGNNSVVAGSYVYVATQTGNGVPATGTVGTTGTVSTSGSGGTTVVYSNTEIGQLLSNTTAANLFASTGSLSFNSFGQVFASPANQGGTTTIAGSFTLNADCTLSVELNDPFGTNKTVTHFSGIVLSGGNEIDLFISPSSTSTSGTSTQPPVAGIQSQGGLVIRLIRAFANNFGCTAGNLTGSYGLSLNGTVTQTGSSSPFLLFTRVTFDGSGNLVSDPAAAGSPLARLQSIGTYQVNPDCTGALTIQRPPAPDSQGAPATTPSTMSVNFALTAPSVLVSPGVSGVSQLSTHPSMVLSVSTAARTATGTGVPQ